MTFGKMKATLRVRKHTMFKAEVFEREYKTWNGIVSSKVSARSTITKMPFTTSFSVGLGKHRFARAKNSTLGIGTQLQCRAFCPHTAQRAA